MEIAITSVPFAVFCRIIVDSHEGNIWVESQLDEGAEFFSSLPLEQKGE